MTVTEDRKTEVYEQFAGKVLHYLLAKVNDASLAEDLRSDVFLKVYEKWDTYDESKASLSTWIFTVTRNTLTDYFRTRHVTEEIPDDLPDSDSVEESICREEMLERLAKALETLDERERDILVLHYYDGVKLLDIAERLGISYTYVKVLHRKALSALRGKL